MSSAGMKPLSERLIAVLHANVRRQLKEIVAVLDRRSLPAGRGCLLEVRDATLGRYLEPGDEVVLRIDRLGALRNPIVARGT